jgi:hypothetical protein
MLLPEELIAAIDARVAFALQQSHAWGVVASRDSTVDAQVVFDGSALAVPVKVAADVDAFEGDRVAMAKVGRWWTVLGSMTRHWPTDAVAWQNQGSGSTASTTFANTPTTTAVTFTKRWDNTRVLAAMTGSAYVDTSATDIEFGLKFVDADGVVTTTAAIVSWLFDTTNAHRTKSDYKIVSGLAAGTYTVTAQWRHGATGGGTDSTFGYDVISFHVAEIGP